MREFDVRLYVEHRRFYCYLLVDVLLLFVGEGAHFAAIVEADIDYPLGEVVAICASVLP